MNANARAATETLQEAENRLASPAVRDGFTPEALHEYRLPDGTPLFWRIRYRNPVTREKWIRPMRWTGAEYALGAGDKPAAGWPLYRLPELLAAPDAPVWVAEGEPCADALAALGLVATTSGSSSSADAADWEPLRSRTVTIWPDTDEPGRKYAKVVTDKLRALGCSVRIVDVAALALPEKGDAVDWLNAHPGATAAAVSSLKTIPAPDADGFAPEPLRRPVPPARPYPVDALGAIIAPACGAIRRVIQAPDAICAASLLAVASLATQALANVRMDELDTPLSLWFLTVAESGERKSAVDAATMRALREVERARIAAYDTDRLTYTAKRAEYDARCEAAGAEARKAKGVGLANALQALGAPPSPPLEPLFTVADFTAEGVAKLLQRGRPSLGAFTDEAGLVFGGHGMTKETTTRTAATLSKLWDRGELDRVRAADGASKLYGKRLALHLMAQPVIAERALSDVVLAGQGFMARCLLAWPMPTAGTRDYVPESLRDNVDVVRFHDRIRQLLELPLPLKDGEGAELEPRRLALTQNAREVWMRLYNNVEHQEAPSGRYVVAKPWASKAGEQMLRVAGVLELFRNPVAVQIEAGSIEAAGRIVDWHLDEAVRLAGVAEISQEVRDAEALLEWCHKAGIEYLHSRAALRLGPARIRERQRFMVAMDTLESAGWACRCEKGMKLDGAFRRNVWRIVPADAGDGAS